VVSGSYQVGETPEHRHNLVRRVLFGRNDLDAGFVLLAQSGQYLLADVCIQSLHGEQHDIQIVPLDSVDDKVPVRFNQMPAPFTPLVVPGKIIRPVKAFIFLP
jgi:hypothetical protein